MLAWRERTSRPRRVQAHEPHLSECRVEDHVARELCGGRGDLDLVDVREPDLPPDVAADLAGIQDVVERPDVDHGGDGGRGRGP
jgi:hypothetical protein